MGMMSKKTMEINPRHPIIIELSKLSSDENNEGTAKDLAFLLYDTAALNSGFDMENPKEFSQRMYRLMQSGLSLENLNLVDEAEIPEEEEEPEEVVDLDDNDSELEED